jgi:hypothetical protein
MAYLRIFNPESPPRIAVFPSILLAAGLTISPDEDPIYFGEVYAYEKVQLEQCKFAFTLTPTSGDCHLDLERPGLPTPSPITHKISFVSPISEPTPILVCISHKQPGEYDLQIFIPTSDCGDLSRTLRFTCIGLARIEGKIRDFFTKQPIPGASVEALSYYLTTVTFGTNSYSGVGRPGTQVIKASAEGYREQIVSVEITEAETLIKDFEMSPVVTVGDVIGALRESCALELPSAPSYHVDMNGDGRIGLEEAILLLHLVSGLR